GKAPPRTANQPIYDAPPSSPLLDCWTETGRSGHRALGWPPHHFQWSDRLTTKWLVTQSIADWMGRYSRHPVLGQPVTLRLVLARGFSGPGTTRHIAARLTGVLHRTPGKICSWQGDGRRVARRPGWQSAR